MTITSILITGANQGIGLEVAKHLVEQPNIRLFLGARTQANLQSAAETLASLPTKDTSSSIVPLLLDVSSDESIAAAAASLTQGLNGEGLDVLINNAGIAIDRQPDLSTREKLQRTYDVNVFGAACLTEALLPLLRASISHNRRPRILNISSSLGRLGSVDPRYAKALVLAYNTSKAALNGQTMHYSRVLPEARVLSICPGHVATSMNNRNPHATNIDEAEGPRFIAKAALETEGPTHQFLSADGEIPW